MGRLLRRIFALVDRLSQASFSALLFLLIVVGIITFPSGNLGHTLFRIIRAGETPLPLAIPAGVMSLLLFFCGAIVIQSLAWKLIQSRKLDSSWPRLVSSCFYFAGLAWSAFRSDYSTPRPWIVTAGAMTATMWWFIAGCVMQYTQLPQDNTPLTVVPRPER
jgi:hypothetical protein